MPGGFTLSRQMPACGTGFGSVLPDRLVSVVNLPFLGLCVLLLYRLCRYSGADRSAAALISCGLTTIPLFGFCALELGADVAGVAFSLAALWLVLSSTQVFPSWPVMAGAASGLAYGYKPLHLVCAVVVGLLILFGREPSEQMRLGRAARLGQRRLRNGFFGTCRDMAAAQPGTAGKSALPDSTGGLDQSRRTDLGTGLAVR